MGLENMRSGNSRCSNLTIALTIVCILLTYNWWSVSTQNYELLRQLDDITDQLKLCSDEKIGCESKRNNVEQQLRETESRVADLKITELKSTDHIKKLMNDVVVQTKLAEKNEKENGYCKTELNSLKNVDDSKKTVIASMKLEKEALDSKLSEMQQKVKELELALKTIKQTTPSSAKVLEGPVQASPSVKNLLEPEDIHINDGPVNDGDHEIDKELDNSAKEIIDEPFVPKNN